MVSKSWANTDLYCLINHWSSDAGAPGVPSWEAIHQTLLFVTGSPSVSERIASLGEGDSEQSEPLSVPDQASGTEGRRRREDGREGEKEDTLLAAWCERGADGAVSLLRRSQMASPTD